MLRNVALTVLLMFCFGHQSFAQGGAMTEKEYDAVMEVANRKMDKLIRRVITETKKFRSNSLISTEVLTIDRFPNEDARWVGVRTKDGKTEEYLNLIYLGKYEYRKENGSAWTKSCFRDCTKGEKNVPSMMIQSTGELPKLTEFLVYDSTLDGEPAKQYIFYRVYNFGKYLNFYRLDTLVNKDGLIVRKTQEESDVFPYNVTGLETVTYQYEPKDMKPIEAPIK